LASIAVRAEAELTERRKAVASQQADVARLQTAAAQARDAADREESRRVQLVKQREAEEKQLVELKQQRKDLAAPNPPSAGSGSPLAAKSSKPQNVPPHDVPAEAPPTEARNGKPAASKPATVQAVTFQGQAGTAQVDVALQGDADVHLGEVTAQHVELIVDRAELAPKLERTLDVSRFGSPLRSISSFRDRRTAGRVRLIAELAQPATPTLDRDPSGAVRWHFATADKHALHTTNLPSPIIGGFGAASTPIAQQSVTQLPPAPGGRRRVYHGATVDLDFKDAPIHDLLRIIADTGHVNLVVPETIDAKVTVRLKRVPWDEALEVILASHGLWYRREGNLYRIAPRKELDAEDQDEAARREAARKAESPKPQVVTLNYASAEELKPKLEGMLSPHGKIEVDQRTNALIINDISGNREQIARLAFDLDTQTPQITIEARIVEARSTFVRQFGVQWGGNALSGAAGGNATGLIFPSSIALTGANEDSQSKNFGVTAPSDFAVNIPAGTGSGEGGALGISLGSIGGNLNINLRLSALEDSGTVRIISAPKITVLNNKQAEIRQGVSIPISVVSAAGTQTQFVQADLKLTVTPYVSQRDCAIAMNLEVTKNEPDFVNVGARGDPTILRKEARTTMLVNDGETTVLGGIYTRNSGLAYKKVPFFGDLPFIGWLFKNRRENDDRTEILVFITPKITNKASLRCTQ
jgi:type IV pilus assembly protein PilQ